MTAIKICIHTLIKYADFCHSTSQKSLSFPNFSFTFCTKAEKDLLTTLENIFKRISWQNMTRLVRQQCIKYLLKGCINIETSFFQWCKWRYIYQMATDKTNFSKIYILTQLLGDLKSCINYRIFSSCWIVKEQKWS